VIIATMIELAQRMLTKRPTVARTSEIGIRPSAKSPTRASDPRTEITRPKDVTMNEPGKNEWFISDYAGPSLDKLLNGSRAGFVKSVTIRPQALFPMCTFRENRLETAAFPHSRRECPLTKGLPCGKAGHLSVGGKQNRPVQPEDGGDRVDVGKRSSSSGSARAGRDGFVDGT
jgi:hypothetical protein